MKKIGCIGLVLLLTGCGSWYTSGAEKRYLKSHNGPGLVINAPLTDDNISHFYDLPEQRTDPTVANTPPLSSTKGLNHDLKHNGT